MNKLFVFDWNGTILADTIPAWQASNICLEFYGVAPISLEKFRETFHFPVIHFYKENGCSIDKVLETKTQANELFQSSYERLAARTRTRTGAREILKTLNDQGVTCIVLSNYLLPRIEAHMERLGLRHFFHYISAHDCDGTTILESTTKAARLSEFMVKRGYRPQDTIIIGDSAEEPEIARHLGLTSISITDGALSRARLKKAGPDYIVNGLKEILPVVRERWGLKV